VDLHLDGQVAVVTGASTGIGRATAIALASEGVKVVGVSRREPDGEVKGITHFVADLSLPETPQRMIEHAMDVHGRLDILVNNAAVALVVEGFLAQDLDQWTKTMELNFMAAVRSMRVAIPYMTHNGGVIVNVASVNARLPAQDGPAYSASKAALLSVGKAIATEYAAQGIRVVTVSPGLTATPMWLGDDGIASQVSAMKGTVASDIADETAASTPMKRFIDPEEIANCVCFVCSPRASAVTGAEFVVDAGLTPTM
jgi:NAD(P)-dependent dehydrogenase (short-subunit alcohol dehydrogenase family)